MRSHGRAPVGLHLPQDRVDTVKKLLACPGIARGQIAAAEETIRLRVLQGPGPKNILPQRTDKTRVRIDAEERQAIYGENREPQRTYRIQSPVHRNQRREDINFFDLLQIHHTPSII